MVAARGTTAVGPPVRWVAALAASLLLCLAGPVLAQGAGTGGPAVTFDPPALSFGDQAVGTTATARTVSVGNPGSSPLNITSATITGADLSEFKTVTDSCSGKTVVSGGMCSLAITFAPTTAGPRAAALTLVDNAPGSPHTLPLTGTSIGTPFADAFVSYNPVIVNDRPTAANRRPQRAVGPPDGQFASLGDGGSAVLRFGDNTLTGSGTADPDLRIHQAGPDPERASVEVSRDASTWISIGKVAGPAAAVDLDAFGLGPADHLYYVRLTDDPDEGQQGGAGASVGADIDAIAALTSALPSPHSRVSPESLTFANQAVGTTSGGQAVTVTNTGSGPLTVASAVVAGANTDDFVPTADTCSGATIGPSGACMLTVAFSPVAAGPRAATLTIADNAPGGPRRVALAGTGTAAAGAAVTVSPSALGFGAHTVGTVSEVHTVTVRNAGTLPTTVSGAAVEGPNAQEFPLVLNSCTGATLAPGASCALGVMFGPALVEGRNAVLNIVATAPGSPRTVVLSGTGTAPATTTTAVPTTTTTTPTSTTTTPTSTTTTAPTNTTSTTTPATTTTTTAPSGTSDDGDDSNSGSGLDPDEPDDSSSTQSDATGAGDTFSDFTDDATDFDDTPSQSGDTGSDADDGGDLFFDDVDGSAGVGSDQFSDDSQPGTDPADDVLDPLQDDPMLDPFGQDQPDFTEDPLTAAGEAGTLLAVTPTGEASGPPGVTLDVAASDYPETCERVYFFFDGSRIGTARPKAGAVTNESLWVPGDAREGPHQISSSCQPSGSPVTNVADFVVTDAALHRTAFATSVSAPTQVDSTGRQLMLSAAVALGLLALIALSAELLGNTLKAHDDEVRGWFRLAPPDPAESSRLPAVALLVFLVLSGPLWFTMRNTSELDASTAAAALGLSLATAVVVLVSLLPTAVYLRRTYKERARLVALPAGLALAVACVLLSRALDIQPGLAYGLVGGLVFGRRLQDATTGRLAASSAAILAVLGLSAWMGVGPLSDAAAEPSAEFPLLVAESLLAGIFWVSLTSLVVALIPLRPLLGAAIAAWDRRVWAVLYAVVLFAFVHILLQPDADFAAAGRSPATVVVGLFVAFAFFAAGFWAYFRFRRPRRVLAGAGAGAVEELGTG